MHDLGTSYVVLARNRCGRVDADDARVVVWNAVLADGHRVGPVCPMRGAA